MSCLFSSLLIHIQNYFKDFWNNFDMVIVLGSLFDFLIKKILVSVSTDELIYTCFFLLINYIP